MTYVSPLNTGIIARGDSESAGDASARTIIVTGVARSGTSMVASVLRAAGIFMGEFVWDVVQEDSQMLAAMRSHDQRMLQALIERRNADHGTWGFKAPDLFNYLRLEQMSWFRDPRLIIIFRDPVAVAVRHALSERFDQASSIASSTNAMLSMARFAEASGCPTMFLSYEKALTFPDKMVESLLAFCGTSVDDSSMDALIDAVQPNSPDYLAKANRHFGGCIEGVLHHELFGWCHQSGDLSPLSIELIADGACLGVFTADRFREDLLVSRIGNGNHGFFIDLRPFGLGPDALIKVKVKGRTFELNNSDRRLGSYPVSHDDPAIQAFSQPDTVPEDVPSLAMADQAS